MQDGVQRQRHLDIRVKKHHPCACCGEKHFHIHVHRKVAITPDGATDPLPVIGTTAVSAATLDTAIEVFDEIFYDDYADMLVASVSNMAVTDVLDTVSQGDWTWDQAVKRYQNTSTGTIVTENTLIEMRDEMIEKWRPRVQSLADDLATGKLTVQEWTLQMRRELRNVFSNEYLLAKGGRNAMFQPDLDAINEMLNTQNFYLQNFAEEVRAGSLSQAQIAARSELYAESATQAHERGKASRHAVVLPYYPADGSQDCRSRCRCRWDLDETEDTVIATWLLNVGVKHCNTCLANAAVEPITITKAV